MTGQAVNVRRFCAVSQVCLLTAKSSLCRVCCVCREPSQSAHGICTWRRVCCVCREPLWKLTANSMYFLLHKIAVLSMARLSFGMAVNSVSSVMKMSQFNIFFSSVDSHVWYGLRSMRHGDYLSHLVCLICSMAG
jgi:hypothetical protein